MAHAYRLGGDLASAGEAYREVIRREPDQFHAHFELAGLFKEISDRAAFKLRGDLESAVPFGTSAREWARELALLEEEVGSYGQFALASFGTALRIRPFDFESIFQISEILRRSGQSGESLEVLDWLSRRQGKHWIHYYRRGALLIELGQYEPALRALKRALELKPIQGDVYFALGFAYVQTGRLSEAIDTFQKGALYQPFNPGTYVNLGAAHGNRGDFQLARRALERSLELATFPATSGPPIPHEPGTVEPEAGSHRRWDQGSEDRLAPLSKLSIRPGAIG